VERFEEESWLVMEVEACRCEVFDVTEELLDADSSDSSASMEEGTCAKVRVVAVPSCMRNERG